MAKSRELPGAPPRTPCKGSVMDYPHRALRTFISRGKSLYAPSHFKHSWHAGHRLRPIPRNGLTPLDVFQFHIQCSYKTDSRKGHELNSNSYDCLLQYYIKTLHYFVSLDMITQFNSIQFKFYYHFQHNNEQKVNVYIMYGIINMHTFF